MQLQGGLRLILAVVSDLSPMPILLLLAGPEKSGRWIEVDTSGRVRFIAYADPATISRSRKKWKCGFCMTKRRPRQMPGSPIYIDQRSMEI